jgi:hypothetical protein
MYLCAHTNVLNNAYTTAAINFVFYVADTVVGICVVSEHQHDNNDGLYLEIHSYYYSRIELFKTLAIHQFVVHCRTTVDQHLKISRWILLFACYLPVSIIYFRLRSHDLFQWA